MESSNAVIPDGVQGVTKGLDEAGQTIAPSKSVNSNVPGLILGISGLSAIIAAVIAAQTEKKRSLKLFGAVRNVTNNSKYRQIRAEGTILAIKALAWGTFYAVGGFSLIVIAVWKYMGFKNLEEFKSVMRRKIKKQNTSNEETDFENWSDLFNYLKSKHETESKKKQN